MRSRFQSFFSLILVREKGPAIFDNYKELISKIVVDFALRLALSLLRVTSVKLHGEGLGLCSVIVSHKLKFILKTPHFWMVSFEPILVRINRMIEEWLIITLTVECSLLVFYLNLNFISIRVFIKVEI